MSITSREPQPVRTRLNPSDAKVREGANQGLSLKMTRSQLQLVPSNLEILTHKAAESHCQGLVVEFEEGLALA